MALAGMILKKTPDASESLRSTIEQIAGVSLEEITPEGDWILLVEAKTIDALHEICAVIEKTDGVLGVYPSYITTMDEDSDAR